jgi:outer membrane protein TolC
VRRLDPVVRVNRGAGRCATVLPAVFALSLLAPAASPGDRVVTLDEAVRSADLAPEIVAARAGEQAAEAEIRVARSLPDLEASLITNSINAREAASFTVPLPWPARGSRVGAATAGLRFAGREREEALATARQAVRTAWFTLAAAQERARAAADRQDRARRNAEAVAALFGEGRVARVEQVRAGAESALASAERGSAEETARSAGAALAILMGLPPETAVTAAADAATARWTLARRLRTPRFGITGGAEWNDPTQEGTNSYVGVTLAIPITAPASAAAALGERDRQIALLEQARRAAAVAVEIAWGATRAARLRFEAIDHEVLPVSRQTAELTRVAYQEGKADVFRLLDAERLLSEAEVARADAYQAWGTAHADLLRVTGQDAP